MKSLLLTLYIFLLLAASVFMVSRSVPDMLVEAKWYATLGVVILGAIYGVVYMFVSQRKILCAGFLDIFENSVVAVCSAQATFFLLQLAGLCRGYVDNVSGSFNNVAGLASCLCFSLPLGWRWLSVFRKSSMSVCGNIVTVAFLLCKTVCVVAVVLSASRVGILCILILVAVFLLHEKRMILISVAVVAIVSSVVLTLCIKKDSSRGRWFIMQRTIEMIVAKPFTGWGVGGFDAHYMDVQADYFIANPDSEYEMLADNVRHPFNEYLLIAVDYGLFGLIIVLLISSSIIGYGILHPSVYSCTGLSLLGCIMIFSLFSYPFLYPFTWLMLAYSLFCIFYRPVRLHRSVCLMMFVLLSIAAWQLTDKMLRAAELRLIQDKAEYGMARRMLPHYARLYSVMKTDYGFLYNYSAVLYDTGRYVEALRMIDECRCYMSGYELCMLRGDICVALNDTEGAVSAYSRAHNMCPCRFAPLYEMACVYRETGQIEAARAVARGIVNKRVKVPSVDIDKMKRDMYDLLEDI